MAAWTMPAKAKKPLVRNATAKEVRKALGISERTLRVWMNQKGMPHSRGGPGKPNHFSLREIQEWMRLVGLTGDVGRPPAAAALGKKASPELEAIEVRKQKAITEKHELQAAKLRGELLPRQDVEDAAGEVFGAWVTAIRSTARTADAKWRHKAEALAEKMIESGLDRSKAAMGKLAT